MKFSKLIVALGASFAVAGAHASVVSFQATSPSVSQSTSLYWDMLSSNSGTTALGALGGLTLTDHGDIHFNSAVVNFVNGVGTSGINLAAGTTIGASSNWGDNSGFVTTTSGGCDFNSKCIYGLALTLNDGLHYGWVQFHEQNTNNQKLIGWGYESVANVSIAAGAVAAAAAVPEPASLALLGLGLAGIGGLRRKRAA
jgi:hypothetical protein